MIVFQGTGERNYSFSFYICSLLVIDSNKVKKLATLIISKRGSPGCGMLSVLALASGKRKRDKPTVVEFYSV